MAVLAMLVTLLSPQSAAAHNTADFPLRPIRLVIGAPPCGEADTLARLVGEYVGEDLGQPVILDYKPGAANNIAGEAVARSKPDGYTLHLGSRPNTIHKVMYPSINYDYARDLVPVGLVGTMTPILVAGIHTPINSVQSLVQMAKERPGQLTCGSIGVGSTPHVLCEILKAAWGIDLRHIPYRGSAAAATGMVNGHIDVQITMLGSALPYINAGKVRALAILGRTRLPALPDVPTLGELGVPGADYRIWSGLLAPTGTPTQIVERLNKSLNAALNNPKVVEALSQNGIDPPAAPNSPAEFAKLIASETEFWTEVLRKHGIRPADAGGKREGAADQTGAGGSGAN